MDFLFACLLFKWDSRNLICLLKVSAFRRLLRVFDVEKVKHLSSSLKDT